MMLKDTAVNAKKKKNKHKNKKKTVAKLHVFLTNKAIYCFSSVKYNVRILLVIFLLHPLSTSPQLWGKHKSSHTNQRERDTIDSENLLQRFRLYRSRLQLLYKKNSPYLSLPGTFLSNWFFEFLWVLVSERLCSKVTHQRLWNQQQIRRGDYLLMRIINILKK